MNLETVLHNIKTNNIGFFTGKTGLVYLLTDHNVPSIEEYMSELDFDNLSFSEGITGVGWVLQNLIASNKCSLKYNQILEKIDNIIYKKVVQKKIFSLSLFSESGLLGKALYLFERVKSKQNPIKSYYNYITSKECLYLLIAEICQTLNIIKEKQDKIFNKRSDYYLEIGQSFVFLYLCMKANINREYVQNQLRELRFFIESIINNIKSIDSDNAHFLFYLIYAYSFIAFDTLESSMICQCNKWVQTLILKIKIYLDCPDYQLLNSLIRKTNINDLELIQIEYPINVNNFYLWDYLYIKENNNLIDTNPNLRAFLLE